MTEAPDEPATEPPRLTWRCPICKHLLVLRSSTEDEETFRARCAAHERGAKACRANLLTAQLRNSGMESLRNGDDSFAIGYSVLNQAGLVTRYQTHVVQPSLLKKASKRKRRAIKKSIEYAVLPSPILPTPWAPSWAVRYEKYLREKRKRTTAERVADLAEAAADPERAQAFLALLVDEKG